MATYSTNLALTLMATGEQSNTWGDTTNTNLGTLLEQAISGYVTQAITDGADTTITIPNGTTGVARNMFLELTGALTATRNLIVPANKKLYFVYNNTTGGYAVTVKVSGLTGVSVPNGRKVILVSNGTDIVEAHNAISGNATVGGTLGVTGVATLGNGAVLGTPASGTVTNLTGTASININGTVGATAANTGAFTTLTATLDSTFSSTGALLISKGTTAQRPSPATAMLRYNTTTNEFEGYSGASPAWASVGGSAISNDTTTATNLYPAFLSATTGTAANIYTSNSNYLYKPSTGELAAKVMNASNGLVVNSQTVGTSYTMASGNSAMSAGPITLSGGVVVTIPGGGRWVIL
jgi:hypothetical protein